MIRIDIAIDPTRKAGGQCGFTLLEMIVSMTILGILLAIAGMGIVIGTQGYLLTRENASIAQKSQMAMTRLSREMMEMTAISAENFSSPSGDMTYVIYENLQGLHAIAHEGKQIKLFDLATDAVPIIADGDALIDDVVEDGAGLSIVFLKEDQIWTTADPFSDLSRIDISFKIHRLDNEVGDKTFSTSIFPRNRR